MRKDIFEVQMGRIAAAFGSTTKPERMRVYWEEFEHVQEEVWERACEQAIRNAERFPSVREMIGRVAEAMRTLGKNPIDKDGRDKEGRYVPTCGGKTALESVQQTIAYIRSCGREPHPALLRCAEDLAALNRTNAGNREETRP